MKIQVRKCSEVEDGFPYKAGGVTMLRIQPDSIEYAPTLTEKRSLLDRAIADGGVVLAIWTGRYRSDPFLIEDLSAARASLGP